MDLFVRCKSTVFRTDIPIFMDAYYFSFIYVTSVFKVVESHFFF